MVERLARWCYRHRYRTVFVWIVALVGSITPMNVAGGAYTSDFSLPGSETQEAPDRRDRRGRG